MKIRFCISFLNSFTNSICCLFMTTENWQQIDFWQQIGGCIWFIWYNLYLEIRQIRKFQNLQDITEIKISTLNFLVSNRVLESVGFKNLPLSVFAPGENTRGTFYQHSRPPSKILLLVLSGPVGPNDANLIFVRNSHAKCWKNKDNILQKFHS